MDQRKRVVVIQPCGAGRGPGLEEPRACVTATSPVLRGLGFGFCLFLKITEENQII